MTVVDSLLLRKSAPGACAVPTLVPMDFVPILAISGHQIARLEGVAAVLLLVVGWLFGFMVPMLRQEMSSHSDRSSSDEPAHDAESQ